MHWKLFHWLEKKTFISQMLIEKCISFIFIFVSYYVLLSSLIPWTCLKCFPVESCGNKCTYFSSKQYSLYDILLFLRKFEFLLISETLIPMYMPRAATTWQWIKMPSEFILICGKWKPYFQFTLEMTEWKVQCPFLTLHYYIFFPISY